MTGMQEVPTDELLSFQDFPPIQHTNNFGSNTTASIQITEDNLKNDSPRTSESFQNNERTDPLEENQETSSKSFWTLKYYQHFFDVDTVEVLERLLASITPRRNSVMNNKIKLKPDLYGPFWISMTLIFTIAISGNIANYLQHANAEYHWKYDFHLVSYASTAILLYISVIPLLVWAAFKWSTDSSELENLVEETISTPLELICVYGYSLFIYIPVSILWTIQISWLQWSLVLIAALLSGSVLIITLYPALQLSKHKIILMAGIVGCHVLLAVGFMLFFFHSPDSSIVDVPQPPMQNPTVPSVLVQNVTKVKA
ncbi:hypothetical protein RN001_004125 [Aquatica leii]|uniref:Protein YIPF n=1 Tax=Aquatica leii TaxID=1421715 RepID=A0AAN7Q723_9COLE|nr:hypothetical protein RN001_004125 [Aquatica leii]